ncbi:hypothetical protein AKO1_012962 [Acrasis kona]|uniref:Uncharacterized protein n=1 Tax=Acrasis kona TaxID=1008807 RepID=A0AAW2Z073_9EUKA
MNKPEVCIPRSNNLNSSKTYTPLDDVSHIVANKCSGQARSGETVVLKNTDFEDFVDQSHEDRTTSACIELLNKGIDSSKHNLLEDAVNYFMECISKCHKFKNLLYIRIKATHMLAQSRKDMDDFSSAVNHFKEVLSLSKLMESDSIDTSSVYLSLANTLSIMNCIDEAIQMYTECLSLYPDMYSAMYNRSMTYFGASRFTEAVAGFKEITSKFSSSIEVNCVDALYYLGRSQELIGDVSSAFVNYSAVIKFDPHHVLANYQSGRIFYDSGSYEMAIECFSKVLQLKPHDYMCFYNRGMCFKMVKEQDKAFQDFENAILFNNKYVKAYVEAARTNPNVSLRYYDEAISLASNGIPYDDTAQIYFERGVYYNHKKMYQEAVRDYSKCCEIDNTHLESFFNRGAIYSRELNKTDLALQDFQFILNQREDSQTLMERSFLYNTLGEPSLASLDLEKAERINRKDAEVR